MFFSRLFSHLSRGIECGLNNNHSNHGRLQNKQSIIGGLKAKRRVTLSHAGHYLLVPTRHGYVFREHILSWSAASHLRLSTQCHSRERLDKSDY